MSSTSADVKILLNAEDNASEVVTGAARRINREFTDMTRQNRALERSMILNNKTFFETANTLNRVGNIAQRGLSIWQSYNISQMRVADAKRNVRDITRDLNRAIVDGDYEAAAQLTEELADANADLARANQDSLAQNLLMIPAIAGLIDPAAKAAINIRQLAHSYGILGRNAKGVGGATALTGALGGMAAGGSTAAAGGLAGAIGSKVKNFAGSTVGKVLLPVGAFAATYGYLTETEEGRAINEYNPFKLLADAIFIGTHSSEEVARARAGQTVNIYGASTSDVMDEVALGAQQGTVFD